jgi:hypothetical protein
MDAKMGSLNTATVRITPEVLSMIAEIDEFKGAWRAIGRIAPERLSGLRRVATIESVGSSTRIEGARLTDREVERLLANIRLGSFTTRDEQEVAGYAEVMETIFSAYEAIPVNENHIRQLHPDLLAHSTKDERHRGAYKNLSNNVGVQTTSLLAALGAAGLAIGLALQGTLQNIAAGIMLLVLRPLRVGEYIETGSVKGFIIEIGLFTTEMKTADGLYLMAPNSTLWNTPITNHSREQERRQELSIAIGNDADASAVKQAILRIVTGDKRVKSSPPPRVFSDGLTADKTVLTLQYWATTSQWSDTRYDMIDALKDGLKAQGVILK